MQITSLAHTLRAPFVGSAGGILAIRGGAAKVAALQDFSGAAAGYFDGIRTPASLVLGSTLGALFIAGTNIYGDNEVPKSRVERVCISGYTVCMLISFIFALNTLVTATAAGVTILHGDFNPMSTSAYMFLSTEFEYEFLAVRLGYLYSLFLFIVGVTTRALLEFGLLRKSEGNKKRDAAYALCLGMASLSSNLLSYINYTLHDSQNLVGMTFRLISMVLKRALVRGKPLQIASLAFGVASLFYFGLIIKKDKDITLTSS